VKDNISEDMDLALLIANAAGPGSGPIIDKPPTEIETCVNCNVLHPTYLTKAVLPLFKARKERSGLIIVSSVMAHFFNPGFTMYAVSKVFNTYFTLGLGFELQKEGHKIDVLDYKPGFVETKLSGQKRGLLCIIPEEAAGQSLDDLGQTASTNAALVHQITDWASRWGARVAPGLNGSIMYSEGKKKFIKDHKQN
jgi:short-subunit dehydrogenase